ncbi:MAG: WbqC family protein [Nitrospirae bacterium]|nr:WbqC family protein [Nitrospirota bacterium]
MQPYFFPYLGYWQLIRAADIFVVYDDVTYIKQGYISRNSILINGEAKRITLRLNNAGSYALINHLTVGNNRAKILKSIEYAYRRAPQFRDVFPVITECVMNSEDNLAVYLTDSIKAVCAYMKTSTRIIYSSELDKDKDLRAQDKVINICKILRTSEYINSIGGVSLYNSETFRQHNITLSFLRSKDVRYRQFSGAFVPNLSIIDAMMFNSPDELKVLLDAYDLVCR